MWCLLVRDSCKSDSIGSGSDTPGLSIPTLLDPLPQTRNLSDTSCFHFFLSCLLHSLTSPCDRHNPYETLARPTPPPPSSPQEPPMIHPPTKRHMHVPSRSPLLTTPEKYWNISAETRHGKLPTTRLPQITQPLTNLQLDPMTRLPELSRGRRANSWPRWHEQGPQSTSCQCDIPDQNPHYRRQPRKTINITNATWDNGITSDRNDCNTLYNKDGVTSLSPTTASEHNWRDAVYHYPS